MLKTSSPIVVIMGDLRLEKMTVGCEESLTVVGLDTLGKRRSTGAAHRHEHDQYQYQAKRSDHHVLGVLPSPLSPCGGLFQLAHEAG